MQTVVHYSLNILIANFRRVLNVVCFLLGNSPASEFYMPKFRNTLLHLHRRIGVKNDLLTPWSRVLLEKLTGSAASQEIPRIFGTRMFLTVPISARHLSLS